MSDPTLPLIDGSYGKPRTYDLPGQCLTCGQRFTVRRCKGDKPPLSVDCPNCECTEYSWRDLNAILGQPAAPAEGLREALGAVAKERAHQDAKWGEQNHDATVWLTVLTEEIGELADAILSRRALLAGGYRIGPAVEAMRNEAAQVAAVAVAFIEWVDRGAPVHENAAAETAAVEIAHHETRAALEADR